MNYSQADIDFMRRDAMRRTREMHQSINKGRVQASNTESYGKQEEKILEEEIKHTENNNKQANTNPLNSLFSELFSGKKLDNDKLIIIALIIILAKEGTDLKLLIALGYILM